MMGIKKILEQLKKEKNKLDYLEKELKKAENKKLKKEINDLIEKLKKQEEKKENSEEEKVKIPPLEQIAMSVPRMQAVQTERIENYQSRASGRRVEIPNLSQQGEETRRQTSYGDDYGSNIKSDYMRTKADFNRQLETSGLTTRSGFTTTAESKHAIQQRAGERREYIESENFQVEQYIAREEMMREDERFSLVPQHSKRKKEMETYHGGHI